MTVLESKSITLAEVKELVGTSERGEVIQKFIKNFDVITIERALEMKKELEALDLIRLKKDSIVKIVDFLPIDASELNKVVNDASFDQEEINKILEVVRKY